MKGKLTFENADGVKLSAVLSNPTGNNEKPIIILCHGFASSKNSKTYTTLESKLNGNNISTFRFDFFGHGESGGKFEDITITKAVNDTLSAIIFLKKNYSKIGLMGSSFGGMASLLAASQNKNLFALALKAPVSDYLGKLVAEHTENKIKQWREKGYINYRTNKEKLKLNFSFYKDASNISTYKYIRDIEIPTLIVHGDKDKSVPLKQSVKTAMLMKDCNLEIIPGADHRFSKKKNFNKMIKLITKFITEHASKQTVS